MAIKEWVTTYKGVNPVQDPSPVNQVGVQENLNDESAPGAGDGDATRSSQIEETRDKLDAAARLLGDSANAPVGSIVEILDRDHANGDARQLRMREIASAPTGVADKVIFYALDDGGVTKAYVKLSNDTQVELGSGGGGSPLTTKGDIFGYDTADARIPVGSNDQVLTADSTQSLGVKWATPLTIYEEEFTASAGANEFTLSTTPSANTNTLSGRNVIGVFRNGVRSRYQASVTLANEYNQSGGTDKINVTGQSGGEIFTVVFGV